jgi:hypothetical protein
MTEEHQAHEPTSEPKPEWMIAPFRLTMRGEDECDFESIISDTQRISGTVRAKSVEDAKAALEETYPGITFVQ